MSKKSSAALGDVELVVTPEQMYQAASLVEQNIKSARTAFDDMLNNIKATSSYWEGAAADKERSRFSDESENFSALITNLNNYVKELRMITGIYESSEKDSVAEACSLMTDILS